MARKKKPPRNTRPPRKVTPKKPTVAKPVENEQKLEADIENLIKEENVTPEEIELTDIKKETIPDSPKISSIKDIYHKALGIQKVLNNRKTELESSIEKYNSKNRETEIEKEKLIQDRSLLKDRLSKYSIELEEINQLRVEEGFNSVIDKKILDHYQGKISEQEKLITEKINDLADKNKEYISLKVELEARKIDFEKEYIDKLTTEKERLQEEFDKRIAAKDSELQKFEELLQRKERELDLKQREIAIGLEDLTDFTKNIAKKEKRKVQDELDHLETYNKNLRDKNKALLSKIEGFESILRHFGERNPKEVLDSLGQKEKEIERLHEKLDLKPDSIKVEEVKQLRNEKASWQENTNKLRADLSGYKSRYEKQKLLIGEKENLELQKEALEQRLKLRNAAFNELRDEVDELTKQEQGKTTFVNCIEMDSKFSTAPEDIIVNNIISKEWVEKLQQSIAQVTENKLYYDLDTIRAFIAGLGMSRFSILQGISGTGKTSLPIAFAQAIGGRYGIVEIQSGWKDKQDLIGYYNTFEKKYYEGKFLKYLYMAGTQKYKDKPFFIILDEMNLSHPEHYFADILSLMEQTDPNKQILTISDKVTDKPKLMQELDEGGIGLKIPNNVWFIGTANHDETTLQFAPKTYDRANVMEMPKDPTQFKVEKINPNEVSISNHTLLDHFRKSKHSVTEIIKYLESSDFKDACNKLGIGWGNRLDKQIKRFVPVFTSMKGSEANALDHIIATKILRSISGRYNLQESILNDLKNELEINFKNQFKSTPIKSLDIVNTELNKVSSE